MRGGHGISLTNAGHLLLNRARELSDLLDKTETELKTPDVASGEVSIACSETRATYNLLYTASLLVREHVGAALCLDGIVAPSPENGLAFIPLAPSLTSHVELIWSRSHRLSPAGQAFLEAAATYLDKDREQALQ